MEDHPLVILLVEDEERDAQLFAIAVEEARLDIHLEAVPSGQAAVEYIIGTGAYRDRLQHPAPDIIVLDLFLPPAPGTSFLKWCRTSALCKHLPQVILTGTLEGDKLFQEALKRGATRAYLKPASIYDLIRIVREIYDLGMECKQAPAGAHETPR